MSEYLLTTRNLTKTFGKHKAVDGINMHIKKGSIYGFIGRNGAGKTTFMKIISGLSAPSEGEFSLFGYPYSEIIATQQIIAHNHTNETTLCSPLNELLKILLK